MNIKLNVVFIVFGTNQNKMHYQRIYYNSILYFSRKVKIHFISTYKMFSRGNAFNIGVKFIKNAKIIMLCDIDMCFDVEFVRGCISHPKQGKIAYFPIVFSQYLIHRDDFNVSFYLTDLSKYINDENGIWRDYGYGIVCIYRSDFLKTNGMTELYDWGHEDVDFYQKIVTKTNLRAFRVRDSHIVHLYHYPTCVFNQNQSTIPSCIASNLNLIASTNNLLKALMNNSL